jgi:hypothetical protein
VEEYAERQAFRGVIAAFGGAWFRFDLLAVQ